MKRSIATQCLFIILMSSILSAVNVTFQVDMANEDISMDAVYITPWSGFNTFDDIHTSVMEDLSGVLFHTYYHFTLKSHNTLIATVR